MIKLVSTILIIIICLNFAASEMLDVNAPGLLDNNLDDTYDIILNDLLSDNRVIANVDGKMWVPWYSTSSSCSINDLQKNNACSAYIDETHNCMVTDEFSQVGVLVSMGENEQKMQEFFSTVKSIKSSNGILPSWRIYRNGDVFEACKPGINGNCDTASDATARIIISLYTASENPNFNQISRDEYRQYADALVADFLEYEVERTCKDTRYGQVCNWLAAGSNVKKSGMSSTDYGYTGYYPDAIIAMLMACSQTGNHEYCKVAEDFSLNYLQASKFDGSKFTVPPGRSFRWINSGSFPEAECTNTCSPVQWDSADAPRALGICQANYYAGKIGFELDNLEEYCNLWQQKFVGDPNKVPLQYTPEGNAVSYQSGYFAQGLQSLLLSGTDEKLYKEAVMNALRHYNPNSKTWDSAACFGVYTQAFPIRSLGFGLGRDENVFGGAISVPASDSAVVMPVQENSASWQEQNSLPLISLLTYFSTHGKMISDITSGDCRVLKYDNGIQVMACIKGDIVEVYKKSSPDIDFKTCIGNGCIDRYRGFDKFFLSDASIQPQKAEPGIGQNEEVPSIPPIAPADARTDIVSVSALQYSCTGESGCTKTKDETSGECRTLEFSTAKGNIRIQACKKENNYVEIYRQEFPNGDFKICLGKACIDKNSGYARFELVREQSLPVVPVEESPIVNEPNFAGINGLQYSCKVDNQACNMESDITFGTCRTIKFTSNSGNIKIMGCDKGDKIEVYRQEFVGMDFNACIGKGCVDNNRGFSSFTK